jgi:hypothetical protein
MIDANALEVAASFSPRLFRFSLARWKGLVMRFCIIMATSMIAAAALAEERLDPTTVRETAQASIQWLEKDMRDWREGNSCAACHHGPMYLWSMQQARRQGYAVDGAQLQDYTKWMLTDESARIFPRVAKSELRSAEQRTKKTCLNEMKDDPDLSVRLSQPTIYLTHALRELPDDDPLKQLGWQKVVNHLAAAQHEDGSFVGRNAWRPIFNTPQILTRFIVTGIEGSDVSHTNREAEQKLLAAAKRFLAAEPPDETQQGLVLRILSLGRTAFQNEADAEQLRRLAAQLWERQRADGGWAQTAERASDAFATGQALVALHRAGYTTKDAAVHNGLRFLVRTREAVGTWPMTSQPNPENGKPADDLNPITYAATAWGTLGLTSFVPGK